MASQNSTKLKDLRNLTLGELSTKANELEAKLFQFKIQKKTGQVMDTAQGWRMRKELSRVKTLETQALKAQASKAQAKEKK